MHLVNPSAISSSDLTLSAAALAAGFVFTCPPESMALLVIPCPFRLITGLPCPGCGSTRAWIAFLHGDVEAAVAANPFAVVLCSALLLLVSWRVASFAAPMIPRPDVGRLILHPLPKTVAVVWMVWALLRAWTAWLA